MSRISSLFLLSPDDYVYYLRSLGFIFSCLTDSRAWGYFGVAFACFLCLWPACHVVDSFLVLIVRCGRHLGVPDPGGCRFTITLLSTLFL